MKELKKVKVIDATEGEIEIDVHYGNPEILELILKYVEEFRGNAKKLSEAAGISRSTFYEYKRQYPQIAKQLKDARLALADDIKNTFYDQCLDGNTTAMIFYLKTQQGWNETQLVKAEVMSKNLEVKNDAEFLSHMTEWKKQETNKD